MILYPPKSPLHETEGSATKENTVSVDDAKIAVNSINKSFARKNQPEKFTSAGIQDFHELGHEMTFALAISKFIGDSLNLPSVKKLYFIPFIALVAVIFTGCASIFTGTTQSIQVNSIPSGANVSVAGLNRGQTPLPVVLKKGSNGEPITLTLSGYQQNTFQPQTAFNPVTILNLWGILGWGIDAATGAMWKYDPTFYNVQLQKASKN